MPRVPVKPFRKDTSNIDILNAIRKNAGTDYQRRIPEATKANIKDVIRHLWDGQNAHNRNEAVDALINQIGLMITRYNSYTNPLAEFKRGKLEFGDSIEEIQVGLVQSYVYEASRDELERAVFGQETPNVQASIHKVSRQEYYKITINEDMLRRAFYKDGGLSEFITQLMDAPTTSDNLDEFNLMLSLFTEYYDAEGFFNIQVPDVSNVTSDEADAKALLRAVRSMSETLGFHTPYYNASGMHTHATLDKLVLFTSPEVKAAIDVEALASAFNMDKANVMNRVVVVPKESLPGNGTQAILTTEDFFVVADTLFETRSIANPAGLYNNYFLHHHQILSVSRFVPAVRFSTEASTVIGSEAPGTITVGAITVNTLDEHGEPTAVTAVERGNQYQLLATGDAATSDFFNDVSLSVEGAQSSFTMLANTGALHVGIDETAAELTFTATSLFDDTKSSTLTVDVNGDVGRLWPNPAVLDEADVVPDPDPDPEP